MDKATEKLILRAVIDKAANNGFNGHLRFCPTVINPTKDKKKDAELYEQLVNDALYFQARNLLFDVGFQNAYFPKGEVDEKTNTLKDWKYHSARMYATNPLEYVESYL
jgi:hypothetical protein